MLDKVAQRLFQSSPDGILAVGIATWGGEQTVFRTRSHPGGWDWEQVCQNALDMIAHMPDRLSITVTIGGQYTLVVETEDDWIVLVAVKVGHPIRKSLRRMFNQTFNKLIKRTAQVIPLHPVNGGQDGDG